MSIGSILNTARLGLSAQQLAIEVASHNIANASVDGYSRQQVSLQASPPLNTPWGQIGTGVLPTSISRIRDSLLDATYRDQNAKANGYAMRQDLVGQINNLFGEPSDSGLSAQMDQFWNAWSDLANNPTTVANKSVVQQRGAALADTLNRYSQSLDNLEQTTRAKVDQQITDLNRYTKQIADINRQIVAAESGGHMASDLRDQRDQLIDKISDIVPVKVMEHDNGSTSLFIGGATIVDGASSKTLSTQVVGGKITVQANGAGLSSSLIGGALSAGIEVLNTDIPGTKQQLDQLAQQLVTVVNAAHRTGWTAAGDALGGANWDASAPPTGSNIDFFDPTGVTAAAISLSSQVATDASYIAVGNVQDATGNNAVANQLALLRSDTSSVLKYGSPAQTTSFGEFYRDLVTRVGVAGNDAASSATVYGTLTEQADLRRQSVSGVATDEELISLTKYQQAYSAAARVVTTADEMAQTLLDMLR